MEPDRRGLFPPFLGLIFIERTNEPNREVDAEERRLTFLARGEGDFFSGDRRGLGVWKSKEGEPLNLRV